MKWSTAILFCLACLVSVPLHAQDLPPEGDPDWVAGFLDQVGPLRAEASRILDDPRSWHVYKNLRNQLRAYGQSGELPFSAYRRARDRSVRRARELTAGFSNYIPERNASCFGNSLEPVGLHVELPEPSFPSGTLANRVSTEMAQWAQRQYEQSFAYSTASDHGLLGSVARGNGACSGLSLVVAAALSHIQFECAGTPPSRDEFMDVLRQAVAVYLNGGEERLVVRGYCGFFPACREVGAPILDLVLETNARNALRPEMWQTVLGGLSSSPDAGLTGAGELDSAHAELARRRTTATFLRDVYESLSRGRAPVALRTPGTGTSLADLSHSVVVVNYRARSREGGGQHVILEVMDPLNPNRLRFWEFSVDHGFTLAMDLRRERTMYRLTY